MVRHRATGFRNTHLILLAAAALLLAHACGGDEGGVAGGTGGGAASGGGGSSGGGTGGGIGGDASLNLDGTNGEIESLIVDPATATIEVTNGTSTPAQFTATATYKNGTSGPVQASWSFDRLDLALIAQSGVLTAHNDKGGEGTVTASLGGLTATAKAIIHLTFEDNPGNLSQSDQDKFQTPDSSPSGTLVYPYDGTVFGRGILAPELMWNGGAAGDKYKVAIVDKNVALTAYLTADPPSRWLMDKKWWTALTESSDGSPVSVKVQRLDGAGVAHQAMSQSWKIAPGNLRGTIYYWAVSKGQIMRINPGADAPVPAFDPGPANQLGTPAPVSGYGGQNPPWDAVSTGKRCVACHTVSRDGSTLAALFSAWEPANARPWGIVDTKTEQIQLVSNYSPGPAIYTALTPNGSHLVHDTIGFKMVLADPKTGATIPSALDAYAQVAVPQFSADGKLMAFASNITGAYPIEYSKGDLDLVDVDLTAPPYFTNRQTIQAAAAANEEISFPSFSPDSKWIVYQRGDYSRAAYQTVAGGPIYTGHNDLFMTDVAKAAGEVKLASASGVGVLGPKDERRNYQPRVNPVAVGGYFWVVFVTPRDYGNRMESTTDSTTQNRKQLWVAAIDANPAPGQDPSHPAFWLPGQDLTTINMDAYWALEPCKQNGIDCSEGYECCTGFCRDQGNGTFQCVPPPTNECSQIGEACTTASDCCPAPGKSIDCIGGFCALPGPA